MVSPHDLAVVATGLLPLNVDPRQVELVADQLSHTARQVTAPLARIEGALTAGVDSRARDLPAKAGAPAAAAERHAR